MTTTISITLPLIVTTEMSDYELKAYKSCIEQEFDLFNIQIPCKDFLEWRRQYVLDTSITLTDKDYKKELTSKHN